MYILNASISEMVTVYGKIGRPLWVFDIYVYSCHTVKVGVMVVHTLTAITDRANISISVKKEIIC